MAFAIGCFSLSIFAVFINKKRKNKIMMRAWILLIPFFFTMMCFIIWMALDCGGLGFSLEEVLEWVG